ncbi:ester cyclase [Hyphomicrobium sp. CS1GBMeth3]|uniref:ester cyclase n=1 Tax=Hyphomicrobium sp. CS1GBMeth3 TaxID=1892845 RepID=UPI001AECA48E|nr:ester cyclase [Hyphomicrobium sp. CS1GBMeth3]
MMQQSEGEAITADLVRRFYDEAWNEADQKVAREILHPSIKFRASLGPEREGADGFINYMLAIHAALADYTCTIDEMLVDGAKAAARLTFAGRHEGEFFGVAGTGRPIAWCGAAFFETDGRQITRLWVLGDVDGVKQQLGVDPQRTF